MTRSGAILFIVIGVVLFVWGFMLNRRAKERSGQKKVKLSKYEVAALRRAAWQHGNSRGHEFGLKWRNRILGVFKKTKP